MKSRRVVTFVPAAEATAFAKAMAGHIPHIFGDYDSVCWWSEAKMEHGTEQFRPLDGDIQQVPSVRMEFSIPNDDQAAERFIDKIKEYHPWQQPVILVFQAEIMNAQNGS